MTTVVDSPAAGALIVGLMAAQFLVHAAGWAMTALMQRRAGGPEGHFALFWLVLALAAALQVPASAPASAGAEAALVAAALAVHRGLLLFYRATPPDRVLAAVLAAALGAQALALAGAVRATAADALCSALVAAVALAGAAAFWRHGRVRTRTLALAAAAAMGTVALGMAARASGLALSADAVRPALGGSALSAAFAIGLFFLAGLFNLAQIRLVLGRVLQQLMAQSHRDALTGVANRRGFMLALDKAHRRAHRERRAYALLMVDIDHFKRINDTQGHAAGDAALREVALQLGQGVRAGDLVGRLGGEEFGVLLPGSDLAGAEGLAERLREIVAAGTPVTVSIGVALALPEGEAAAESAEAVMARADAALYRAKGEGRNRVVVSA